MKTKYIPSNDNDNPISTSRQDVRGHIMQTIRFIGVIHQKFVLGIAVALLSVLSLVSPMGVATVSAEDAPTLGSCVAAEGGSGCLCEGDFVPNSDGTECIPATQTDCNGVDEAGENTVTLNSDNCQVVKYLVIAINFLTAAAGIAIVAGMVYGGYLYLTARDNPGQVQAGRQRIVWALIALLILIFGYAGLQWLVPGGVLNSPPTSSQPL